MAARSMRTNTAGIGREARVAKPGDFVRLGWSVAEVSQGISAALRTREPDPLRRGALAQTANAFTLFAGRACCKRRRKNAVGPSAGQRCSLPATGKGCLAALTFHVDGDADPIDPRDARNYAPDASASDAGSCLCCAFSAPATGKAQYAKPAGKKRQGCRERRGSCRI